MRYLNDKKNLRHVHHAKPQRKNMQLTFLQNNDNSNLRHALLTFSKILIVCLTFIQNFRYLISNITQYHHMVFEIISYLIQEFNMTIN